MAQTKKKTKAKPAPTPPQPVIGLACGIHEKPFERVELGYSGRRYQRTEHVRSFVELICRDCSNAVEQLKKLREAMEMLKSGKTEPEDDEEFQEEGDDV